eukprot:1620156-Pleurochrysis_carterae.AAC.4
MASRLVIPGINLATACRGIRRSRTPSNSASQEVPSSLSLERATPTPRPRKRTASARRCCW